MPTDLIETNAQTSYDDFATSTSRNDFINLTDKISPKAGQCNEVQVERKLLRTLFTPKIYGISTKM